VIYLEWHKEPAMSPLTISFSGSVALLCAAVAGSLGWAQISNSGSRAGTNERARITLSRALPKLDGDHLRATVVEVNYAPGEWSLPHSHPCAVIGYIVKGALRTQVSGEPEAVYTAGESFYEAPNGIHSVSADASKTEASKFIAFFVCDRDTPLSISAPETKGSGVK
jgi:quercetin dioxygenase-like cupin family protein